MAFMYQGRKSGEVFEPGLGVRQYYTLTSTAIEQNTEFKTPDNQPAYIRTIFYGAFQYVDGELAESTVTDYSTQIYVTSGPEKGEVCSSLHFGNPIQRKPHEFNNESLNTATSVNYSYRSSGSSRPSGNALLASHPVTNSRSSLLGYGWSSRVADGWWGSAFSSDDIVSHQSDSDPSQGFDSLVLSVGSGFGREFADVVTNYNPKSDQPIQIDLGSFGGAVGKLKIAKKTKQVAKLAKSDIDFIYDQQAGFLYYNENRNQIGFGEGGIFAILEGKPKVGLGNFEFV
jgi:hypothetical protein